MADEVVIEGDENPPGDTTVVVTTASDSASEELALGIAIGRMETTLAGVLERLDAVESSSRIATQTADDAIVIAESASDTAVDALIEAEADPEPEPEPESEPEMITPEREHVLWKNPLKIPGKN